MGKGNNGHAKKPCGGRGGGLTATTRGSGPTLRRSTLKSMSRYGVICHQLEAEIGRRKAAYAYFQRLLQEDPEIRKLEAYMAALERGQASPGALYGVKHLTYHQAVVNVWKYHLTLLKLGLHAWAFAGVITEAEYRKILEACGLNAV